MEKTVTLISDLPVSVGVHWKNHFKELTSELQRYAHCGILTDLIFISENKNIHVHHIILSCFTLYFQQMMKNKNVKCFVHTEVKYSFLESIRDYIYMGETCISNDYEEGLKTAATLLHLEEFNIFKKVSECKSISFQWPQHQTIFIKIWESRHLHSQCDVIFVTNDNKSYAHSCILAVCSPFLLQVFTKHCVEKSKPFVIALHDVPSSYLELVLEFCYKGHVQISHTDLQSVYNVADLLGIRTLCNELQKQYPSLVHIQQTDQKGKDKMNVIKNNIIPATFSDLLKYERLVDVFIFTGGKLFKAHSVILSVYSVFFKQLAKYLDYGLKDIVVLVKDFGVNNMTAFLDYMYTGEARFEGSAEEFCKQMTEWLDFNLLPVSTCSIPTLENEIKEHDINQISPMLYDAKHCCELQKKANIEQHDKRYDTESETTHNIAVDDKQLHTNIKYVQFTELKEENNHESKHKHQESCNSLENKIQQKFKGRSFTCQICKTTFKTRCSYKEHLLVHPKGNILTCKYCKKEFERQSQLQLHIRTHTGIKPFQCQICGMSFTGKSAMNKHCEVHAKEKAKVLVCEMCNKAFSRKEYLEEHKRTHTGHKPYKCDICQKSFVGKTGLNHHKKTHVNTDEKKCAVCEICGKSFTRHSLWTHMKHHNKEHVCEYCCKRFATTAALKIHVAGTHLGHSWHRCDKCGKGFMQKSHLTRHMKTHQDTTNSQVFACSFCPSKFKEDSKLKTHFRNKHSDSKNQHFTCGICNKHFATQSSVIYHQRLHFGERPHRCSVCGKTFARPYLLRDHVRLHHTEEKLFQCLMCKKKCATQALLKKHTNIHQPLPSSKNKPESLFSCNLCNKTFPSKLALSNHSRTHNYLRPFPCNICRKAFRYQDSLMKHLQLHPEEAKTSNINKELPRIYTIQVSKPSFSQIDAESPVNNNYANDNFVDSEGMDGNNMLQQALSVVTCQDDICLNIGEKSDSNFIQLKSVTATYIPENILHTNESVRTIEFITSGCNSNITSSNLEKTGGNVLPQHSYVTMDGNICCIDILSLGNTVDSPVQLLPQCTGTNITDMNSATSHVMTNF